MTQVVRFDGDIRITGDLAVDGAMPAMARSNLIQDPLTKFAIALTDCRIWDAVNTLLPGTSIADDLAISPGVTIGVFGTHSLYLTTGDVKTTIVTRYARLQVVIPAEYDAGQTFNLRLSAGMETTIADVSATIDIECFKSDRKTGIGADLCGTAAQSINSLVFVDKDFVIDPTGLAAGDILDVRIKMYVEDAATATAVIASIGAVDRLIDIKG